jgi:hypothetical protein
MDIKNTSQGSDNIVNYYEGISQEIERIRHTERLSDELREFLENHLIPKALKKHLLSRFSDFSEECEETFQGETKKLTFRSSKVNFKFYHLATEKLEFHNTLITSAHRSHEGHVLKIVDHRDEVLMTDGYFQKHEKNHSEIEGYFIKKAKQKITVENANYIVILRRKRVKNDESLLEHHDDIEIHVKDRKILDSVMLYTSDLHL